MAKLGSTTFNEGGNDTAITLTDNSSAPSPTAGKLYANSTSLYWEDNDITQGGGEEISKKVSLQLANTTHALDLTKSACTTVNLIITANTTLDGTYYSKHTIIGSSVFPGLQIISDTTNTSTTFTDSSISSHTITAVNNTNHRTDAGIPYSYPKTIANTSIYFDGTNDALTIPDSEEITFEDNDFTLECWSYHAAVDSTENYFGTFNSSGTDTSASVALRKNANNAVRLFVRTAGGSSLTLDSGTLLGATTWNHIAAVRHGDLLKLFINGVQEGERSISGFVNDSSIDFHVGVSTASPGLADDMNGYLDGIRVINGYAAYTSEFSPPTRPFSTNEFEFSVDTSVKYCGQGTLTTSADVGTTVRMGLDTTGSGPAKISIGDAFNINSISYAIPIHIENSASGMNHVRFTIFSEVFGNTELEDTDTNPVRFGNVHYGGRAVFGMGFAPSAPGRVNTMDFVAINSAGNASDFGELSRVSTEADSASNGTRGVYFGGLVPGATNIIDYITIGSTGNGTDFGDLGTASFSFAALSDGYKALTTGGRSDTANEQLPFQHVNITTTANAVDSGGLSSTAQNKASNSGASNGSRGVYYMAGHGPTDMPDTIESVTISSSSNGVDFGNLTQGRHYPAGTDDGSRALHAGGNAPPYVDTIDYLVIGTAANSTDFGELSTGYTSGSAVSNGSRGLFSTFETPTANVNVIEFRLIPIVGDSADFGDLSQARAGGTACSGD